MVMRLKLFVYCSRFQVTACSGVRRNNNSVKNIFAVALNGPFIYVWPGRKDTVESGGCRRCSMEE